MNYLSVENLSKSWGDKVLFENLSFGLAQGQKVALIGVNGCGKSTLLKIMAGLEPPDSGQVTRRRGINVVYLPQEPDLPLHKTVEEVVMGADLPALQLMREYELLTEKATDPAAQARLQEVMAEIDAKGAWDIGRSIREILGKLEVDFPDRLVGTLSGGQRKRVALAQALIEAPDLLLLDEPTNHLDIESIEWLEKYLATSKQSLLLITHDRYFLDSVADEIFELDGGQLYQYQGDYGYFLIKKDEREQVQRAETDKNRNLFRKELEWLRTSPRARTTKSKSRIDAAYVLQDKARHRPEAAEIKLDVKGRRIGGKILEIKNLRKTYGERMIVDNFTYTFARKERIGIIGPNGVGKTTFLRLITGEEEPDNGKVRLGETVVYGYYKQEGFKFKDNQRVIEAVTEAAEYVELSQSQTVSASQLLEHFLFPRHMHYQPVEKLSGGERRRLHLLRILMTNPNFLILDEPTNDLDLVTLRRLEEFLADFEGCLIVVTHDRFFMDRLVDHVFVFEGEGQIRDFPGSYTDFRTREAQEKAEAAAQAAAEAAARPSVRAVTPTVAPAPRTDRPRKLSFKEQREFEALEAEIPRLETRKTELSQQLNAGGADYQQLQALAEEIGRIQAELDAKSDRWLELMAVLEGGG
ncbi:MAG: ABC-F family ATP-binding cassette domain-containing protein [Bacteroidia bacterium]|nr:ABC-F family ATP-binding cassette domain-containing protein [Bacteroidia bacterium]